MISVEEIKEHLKNHPDEQYIPHGREEAEALEAAYEQLENDRVLHEHQEGVNQLKESIQEQNTQTTDLVMFLGSLGATGIDKIIPKSFIEDTDDYFKERKRLLEEYQHPDESKHKEKLTQYHKEEALLDKQFKEGRINRGEHKEKINMVRQQRYQLEYDREKARINHSYTTAHTQAVERAKERIRKKAENGDFMARWQLNRIEKKEKQNSVFRDNDVAKKDVVAQRLGRQVNEHSQALEQLSRTYEKKMQDAGGALTGAFDKKRTVEEIYNRQQEIFSRYHRIASNSESIRVHNLNSVTPRSISSKTTVSKRGANGFFNRFRPRVRGLGPKNIVRSAENKVILDGFMFFARWFFTTPVGIVTLILIIIFGSLYIAFNNMNTVAKLSTVLSSSLSSIQRSSVWNIAGFISSQLTKKSFGENAGLFNQLASVIDFGGTRVQMRGSNTDDTPTYWCTNLVIDSFNVARDRVVLPESLGNVNTMKSYIEENFRYVDYRSSPRAALEAINRSDAVVIFYGTPGEPLLYHVGVAQANINSRGDGTIKTKEANGGWMEFTFFVIDWTIVQRDIPSGNGSAVADVAGFGII